MSKLNKSLVIEGVASTQDKDSQGEILSLAGADISHLKEAKGFANSDHSGRFEHLVGRILDAKIINKASECDTQYQVSQWQKLQKPFLWNKIELFDGNGHKEADAIASVYRHYQDKGEEAPIKLSVEGKVVSRDSKNKHVLKQTVIKGVAITIQPANKSTHTEVVGMMKSMGTESLMKSESRSFIEIKESDAERLLNLVLTANAMLKSLLPK